MKKTRIALFVGMLAVVACDDEPAAVRIVEQPALEDPKFEFSVEYLSTAEDWARADELGSESEDSGDDYPIILDDGSCNCRTTGRPARGLPGLLLLLVIASGRRPRRSRSRARR